LREEIDKMSNVESGLAWLFMIAIYFATWLYINFF